MMEFRTLKEIVEKPITGEWGTEGNGIKVLRTTNFTNEGKVNYAKVVKRNIDSKKVEKKKLKTGDIIIEKSGGSPTQPVGRVIYFDAEGDFLCNNFTAILRPKPEFVFPKYLLFILFANHKYGFTSAYQNKTTGIINLQLPKYLDGTKIPLPPLPEQRKIAAILDEADKLRQLNKNLITKYDELTQSLFLDMFGKYFKKKESFVSISELTHFIDYRGKTLSKVSKGIPYVTAKSVRIGYFDFSRLDYITKETYEKIMVRGYPKIGDVLFTTEGATMGFTCRIPNGLGDFSVGQRLITLQTKDVYNSTVLEFVLNSKEIQNEVFKMATGSAVKGIRAAKFKTIRIPVPPITLQNQFAERVEKIELQKAQAQESLVKAEALFGALLQESFGRFDSAQRPKHSAQRP